LARLEPLREESIMKRHEDDQKLAEQWSLLVMHNEATATDQPWARLASPEVFS
jgi:hypothetical protein